jgi:excisionase family DNA binding protein
MFNLMSVSDAAGVLSLSPARVRLLASSGDLDAEKVGGHWLIDRAAVERRRRRGGFGGRRFNPENAWAVLALASGEEAARIDPGSRSRFRRALSLEGLGALAPRLERRAEVRQYACHPGEISHLLADKRLVRSGANAARAVGLDLLAGNGADGYASEEALDALVREHALLPTSAVEANVVLRIVPGDIWDGFIEGRPHAPEAAVALDLADEADARSRAAGKKLIGRLDQVR